MTSSHPGLGSSRGKSLGLVCKHFEACGRHFFLSLLDMDCIHWLGHEEQERHKSSQGDSEKLMMFDLREFISIRDVSTELSPPMH